MRASLLLQFSLLAARPLFAQAAPSDWNSVTTTDDLTAASDTRLILRADDWPRLPLSAHPDDSKSATLIVSCGNRIPASAGRSLMFFAGQPMEAFGDELAYAELRFDGQPKPIKAYLTILDFGNALVTTTGQRSTRHVAFLGSEKSPFFSEQLFQAILKATTVSLRYTAFGDTRIVSFHVGGLRSHLAQLSACQWPQ